MILRISILCILLAYSCLLAAQQQANTKADSTSYMSIEQAADLIDRDTYSPHGPIFNQRGDRRLLQIGVHQQADQVIIGKKIFLSKSKAADSEKKISLRFEDQQQGSQRFGSSEPFVTENHSTEIADLFGKQQLVILEDASIQSDDFDRPNIASDSLYLPPLLLVHNSLHGELDRFKENTIRWEPADERSFIIIGLEYHVDGKGIYQFDVTEDNGVYTKINELAEGIPIGTKVSMRVIRMLAADLPSMDSWAVVYSTYRAKLDYF